MGSATVELGPGVYEQFRIEVNALLQADSFYRVALYIDDLGASSTDYTEFLSYGGVSSQPGPGQITIYRGSSGVGDVFPGTNTYNFPPLTLLTDCATAVGPQEVPSAPLAMELAAYPNPFNPRTTIAYAVPKAGPVKMDVYDLRGRHVHNLVDGDQGAGRHQLTWNGTDARGRSVATGVYFVRLRSVDDERTLKVVMVE